jgi:chromosomal replication initiator protein
MPFADDHISHSGAAAGPASEVASSHGKANVIEATTRARSERAERPSGQFHETPYPRQERTGVNHSEVLQRVLSRVAAQVGAGETERYFPGQAVLILNGRRLEVRARTGFVAQQMRVRLFDQITAAARQEIDPSIVVEFSSDSRPFNQECKPIPVAVVQPAAVNASVPIAAIPRQRPRSSEGDGRYLLDNYIVGESNKLAYAAAERLADRECPRAFSPLFIHGPCGVGKTHLLQGIAARYRELHPGAVVRCINGETFTNEFINAIRANKVDAFRKSYRGVNMLVIDDTHFLSNKDATQEELLHTFNAIDLTGARVVLASDEHPRNVRKLSDALVSRFLSGMVVRIELPEPALRERITRTLAARRGINIEPAAASLIASRCGGTSGSGSAGGSVRDIEGAITRIEALRTLMPELSAEGGGIGLAMVRKALGLGAEQGGGGRGGRPVRMEMICQEVCRTLGVQLEEVLGRSKHARVVLARTLCTFIARKLTTMSFPEIARALGRGNHSTVVTANKRFERQIAEGKKVDLGSDPGPDFSELTLQGLFERLRDDVQRLASMS